MARIAFIGLGNMGLPMAANLAKAGHTVAGFDLLAANCDKAKAHGLAIAGSAIDAARGADVLVTMLPAGKDTLAVYGGGVLETLSPGAIAIDCSTIDVTAARQAHGLAANASLLSLDCPVSGGVAGAQAATLTLMAGGTGESFERAKPILAAVSKRIVHCGPAGSGQAAKICNNMMLGVQMIAVAEAFVLAEKLGLSHQALFDVASTSSGQCWSLTSYCPVPGPVPASPANNGFKPGFSSALMLKDLQLASSAADRAGVALPLAAHTAALFTAFVEAGGRDRDFSAIIESLRAGILP